VVQVRVAEIAAPDRLQPDQVLGDEGPVEAELRPEALVRLLGEVVAEHHEDGVAGNHPH
jgi:hypothetical protein